MEKGKTLSTTVYGGAAISGLIVLISMFFHYSVAKEGAFKKSGFGIFGSASAMNKVLIVLCLIFALCVIVMGIIRLVGMLDDKIYTYIFASLGVGLATVSIILFATIGKVTWTGYTHEYKRGAGMVLNLIFSIIAGIFCVGSLATAKA